MLQFFQHYFGITDKSRKNRIFHCCFEFWPWSRNNYLMIPTTWQFPANFTLKNYTSKLNFEIKNFRFLKGVSVSVSNRKTTVLRSRMEFFFLWNRKFIIVFFGVKFTGDYRNVASIPTLFRDRRQKSKKPNASSFFRLLSAMPK